MSFLKSLFGKNSKKKEREARARASRSLERNSSLRSVHFDRSAEDREFTASYAMSVGRKQPRSRTKSAPMGDEEEEDAPITFRRTQGRSMLRQSMREDRDSSQEEEERGARRHYSNVLDESSDELINERGRRRGDSDEMREQFLKLQRAVEKERQERKRNHETIDQLTRRLRELEMSNRELSVNNRELQMNMSTYQQALTNNHMQTQGYNGYPLQHSSPHYQHSPSYRQPALMQQPPSLSPIAQHQYPPYPFPATVQPPGSFPYTAPPLETPVMNFRRSDASSSDVSTPIWQEQSYDQTPTRPQSDRAGDEGAGEQLADLSIADDLRHRLQALNDVNMRAEDERVEDDVQNNNGNVVLDGLNDDPPPA